MKASKPIIVEQLLIALMSMVIMSMVSSVGDHAVAAVGMIDSVTILMLALVTSLTTSGTIAVAQHYGRGNRADAAKAGVQSAMLALAFSLILTVLFAVFRTQIIRMLFRSSDVDVIGAGIDFFRIVNFSLPLLAVTQTLFSVMRGCGDADTPKLITLGMNLVNFALGFFLVLDIEIATSLPTAGLGVVGAAVAVSLARLSGLIASVIYIIRMSRAARLDKASCFVFDREASRVIFGLRAPTSIEAILFQVGRLITHVFIAGLGTAAFAANTIGVTVSMLIQVPGNALSLGVMILIGQYAKNGQAEDIKKTNIFAAVVGFVMTGLLCILCLLLAETFANIYFLSPEASRIFRTVFLSSLLVSPLVWPVSLIVPAGLRAAGDVDFTMAVAVISTWAFRIVTGYILGITMELGVLGFWIGMYADWFVRSLLYVWRLLSGKWEKHIDLRTEN